MGILYKEYKGFTLPVEYQHSTNAQVYVNGQLMTNKTDYHITTNFRHEIVLFLLEKHTKVATDIINIISGTNRVAFMVGHSGDTIIIK